MRPCIEPGCPLTTGRTRCAAHERARQREAEACRPTTAARGYGAAHQGARRLLAASLPAHCGYCGLIVDPGEPFDAAHVVDGDPSSGYVVAHPRCNQRAKGWRGISRPHRP